MRLVVQRVSSASVSVDKKVIGRINKGYLVLVGIFKGDSKDVVDKYVEKLSKLRIMKDSEGKMNLTLGSVEGEILVVSQFTLCADIKKGNRPSFVSAQEPLKAEKLYDYFVEKLRSCNIKVETGKFGEYMKINAELDGPVTILLGDGV